MMSGNIIHKKSSGNVARERLKKVLISDRTSCSPEMLEHMLNDMTVSVSKYIEIDRDHSRTGISYDERSMPVLITIMPINRIR